MSLKAGIHWANLLHTSSVAVNKWPSVVIIVHATSGTPLMFCGNKVASCTQLVYSMGNTSPVTHYMYVMCCLQLHFAVLGTKLPGASTLTRIKMSILKVGIQLQVVLPLNE